MEGIGELINVESKRVKELEGELAEAYRIIGEKEVEVQRLRKENAVLKKRLQSEGNVREPELEKKIALLEKRNLQSEGGAGDKEPEVKLEMVDRKAEEIIPKECWDIVFRNLNAEDLLRCRQVCKTFNQLLDMKDFKEKWQFKLILPHLFPYLKTTNRGGDESWEDLYNARLTCQSWRHWIDQYMSEVHGASLFPLPENRDMPHVTCFGESEDIEEFQERFGESNTNPFPFRSVCIWNPERERMLELEDYIHYYYNLQTQLQIDFTKKTAKLLEQFGKHTSRLRLFFRYEQIEGPGTLAMCKLIKSISIHLPNLKELFIDIIRDQPNEEDEAEENEIEEVDSYVAENPLAPLPKLQALSIGVSGLDKAMEDYLLDAFGPQLTKFETYFSENHPTQYQMQRLENVRKLWISLHELRETLEPLRFLQAPLERLKVICKFQSQSLEFWNVDKVLRNVKHLPLELLELRLWDWDRVNLAEAGIDMEEYNNASIKTLILHLHIGNMTDTVVECQVSFNFLQALTKLESLEINLCGEGVRTSHPAELPEVVKLNEYLIGEEGAGEIYDSNVWEKVPSLKTLTIGFVDGAFFPQITFTREEFERIRAIAEEDGPERN